AQHLRQRQGLVPGEGEFVAVVAFRQQQAVGPSRVLITAHALVKRAQQTQLLQHSQSVPR
ncbi:MAG: hypothetical protein ACUVX9_18280, partial [Anaerolineae bacterium]